MTSWLEAAGLLRNKLSGLRNSLVLLLASIVCCIAAACGSPAHVPETSALGRADSTASDRLAVVTNKGVMLWSSATGLHRIGPPLSTGPGVTVSQLTWSPDGRYLAWIQGSPITGTDELVRFDTRTDTWATWQNTQEFGTISFSGSHPVTIAGSFLYSFQPNGSTSPIAIAAFPSISASYDGGFIFTSNPVTPGSSVEIWRASTDGETTSLGILPATGGLSEYDEISASWNGKWIALEKGDHTDVCGNGPSSRLVVMNAETGTVTWPRLPVRGSAKTLWRFSNIMYGEGAVVDFSAYEVRTCTAGRFPTRLFELDHNHIRLVASNVVDGQQGPNGQLAVITGQDALTVLNGYLPDLKIDGRQQLEVAGKVIPVPATPTFISWAPRNP